MSSSDIYNPHFHLISIETAKKYNLQYHFTGRVCKNNHISERFTFGSRKGLCVQCDIEKSNQKKKKSIERKKSTMQYAMKQARDKGERTFTHHTECEKCQTFERHSTGGKCVECLRLWRAENREKIRKEHEQWRDENREEIRKKKRDRYNRIKNTKEYKIDAKCRELVYRCVRNGFYKEKTVFGHLGYNIEQFTNHIESLFLDGMSWDNFGDKWVIDHIYPVSRYIRDGIADPKIINNLSNLMPMWYQHNIQKMDRTLEEWSVLSPYIASIYINNKQL